MISPKLLALLQSFNKYELNSFRKYLQSPFFNENQHLVTLFDLLDTYVRGNTKALDKNKIWKKLFKKSVYSDVRFRRLCSDLNQLAQDFLAYKMYEEQDLTKQSYLLKVFNQRELPKHFATIERYIHKLRKKSPYRHADFFYNNYIFDYEQHLFLENNGVKRTTGKDLEAADKNLDRYYLAVKLKHYCEAINAKNVLNIELSIGLMEALLEAAKKSEYLNEPVIAIYYQIMMTLIDRDNEKHFHSLKHLLDIHSAVLPISEINNMYIYAQNYCIYKINRGQKDAYYRELFEIYRLELQREILFINGKLIPWDYKNIITLGLQLGEYEWIEHFIHAYNERLPKDYRVNAYTYNLASLNFHRKDYTKVIELLREVEYQDVFYALSSRWLLLKTYYELDEYDALDALIDSFRIFLRRNKLISTAKRKQYMNLLRFAQKIMRLPYGDRAAVTKLKTQISEAKAIADKKWLLGILEKME